MHQHHSKRHLGNRAAAWSVELLEQRTLLSGGVFDVSNLPVFHPTSSDINDFANGPLGNAGSHLADVYAEYTSFVDGGGKATKFVSKKETILQYQGTSVAVSVRTRATATGLAKFLRKLGSKIIDVDGIYGTVDAWVPISQLRTVATNGTVAYLNPD